ncbi:MAG: RAD55 family ATPase, partial [Candidatus Binataceae bacterium]
LPADSMTMLVGPSGIGKTTLGLQFLSQSSGKDPGLLFGFYETPPRIKAKANAICPPLKQLLDSGDVEMLWHAPTVHLLDALADRLLHAVRRKKVRRLVIDGLGGLKQALHAGPIERFFAALVHELRGEKVTTICTAEVPEIIGPTITTPLRGLSEITDNHILLRFVEIRAKLYRLVSILKVRDSGFDSALRQFSIAASGIEIDETLANAESILSRFTVSEKS